MTSTSIELTITKFANEHSTIGLGNKWLWVKILLLPIIVMFVIATKIELFCVVQEIAILSRAAPAVQFIGKKRRRYLKIRDTK